MGRPIIAEIVQSALTNNIQVLKKQCMRAQGLWFAVKANAYGHGIDYIVPLLIQHADQIAGLAVASLEEAIHVRSRGWQKPILLLEGCFDQDEWYQACQLGCQLVIQSLWQWQQGVSLLSDQEFQPRLWLKYNSGMNRLGLTLEETRALIAYCEKLGWPKPVLMSHMACADTPQNPQNQIQIQRFEQLIQSYPGHQSSLGNSATAFAFIDSAGDWVRPGISLYGGSPFGHISASELGLKPVMRLKARILRVHQLSAGDRVGYGGRWLAGGSNRIGTLAVGYGDGLHRRATNRASFVWMGPQASASGIRQVEQVHRVPVAGTVSMDLTGVDLSNVPDAKEGDWVELFGELAPVERLAKQLDTINYEVLTAVSARVPRKLVIA